MHEYAYYGRGNAIHSPVQIEWFQNTWDDKSFHVGGKQVITFLDGYYSSPVQDRSHIYEPSRQAHRCRFRHLSPCYSQVPMNATHMSWITPTLPQLVTPPGPQIPPNTVYMTPGLMNLAIIRGEFTTPSLTPLATPTLLNTNMLSKLISLIMKNSGPILDGSTNIPLR